MDKNKIITLDGLKDYDTLIKEWCPVKPDSNAVDGIIRGNLVINGEQVRAHDIIAESITGNLIGSASNAVALYGGQLLTSGDFNELLDCKCYFINDHNLAATFKNIPEQSAGRLNVYAISINPGLNDGNYNYRIQQYITVGGNEYFRKLCEKDGEFIEQSGWYRNTRITPVPSKVNLYTGVISNGTVSKAIMSITNQKIDSFIFFEIYFYNGLTIKTTPFKMLAGALMTIKVSDGQIQFFLDGNILKLTNLSGNDCQILNAYYEQ